MIDAGESEANIATVIQHFKGGASGAQETPAARAPAPSTRAAQGGYGALATLGDFVSGVGQSAMGVVKGGGELLRMIPGVDAASRAIGEVELPAAVVTPQNTAQSVGKFVGDTAQFFTPTGVVGKGAKAAEIAKAAGLTALQTGGDPLTTGASAALTAVIPGARTVQRAASALDESARKSVQRALGAQKENLKVTAMNVAPEMIERGVKGSREEILAQARTALKETGAKKGAEVARLAEAGVTVPGDVVRADLAKATKGLVTTNAAGTIVPIPGAEPVIKRLDKMDRFIASLGPDVPIDQADKLKTVWQKITAKSGLYGGKVASSATDNASAWTFREGASGMKKVLDSGAGDTYQALNKEYAFWKGVKDVLTETQKRTSSQAATGLVGAGAGGIGAGVGYITGDGSIESILKGAAFGIAGRQMIKVLQSPEFLTKVSAPMKKRLADALASGGTATIYGAVRSLLASLPADVKKTLESE